LKDAARKYGISVKALTRLVQDGIIKMARTEKGDRVITVSTVDNDTAARIILEEIRPEQYERLRGEPIRLMEAAREYEVEPSSLLRWVERKYVQELDRGTQKLEIDRGDAKLATDVFHRARELTGSSIKAGWVLRAVLSQLATVGWPGAARGQTRLQLRRLHGLRHLLTPHAVP
jgi:hypothetical protein